MSSILIKCLFFVVWFVNLDCQDYQDRPKILTSNGNIIIEGAQDKNIYLRVNGAKAGIFVQDFNLLHLSLSESGVKYQSAPGDSSENHPNENSILSRIEKLESELLTKSTNFLPNITYLTRRVNNLSRRVSSLLNELIIRSKDECQSNPCQNGGTCLNLLNGHHCLCPSNWEGLNCDIDVNECRNFAGTDLGCQNGATCINKPGTYECLCNVGWFGLHCTRRAKDCSAGNFEMCGYGSCIPIASGEGIKCLCNQGWETNGTGLACLTDVNECDSSRGPRCSTNPRVECINLPGSFRCGQCPPGYEGDGFTCHDIDECVTVSNGGCSPLVSCHNTIGSHLCGPCPPGYQGDGATCTWIGSCNINHGGCHPSAQCVESMSVVQCVCPLGMDGDGMGIHGCYFTVGGNSTQRCESSPCGVHGQCHPLLNGYTCLCQNGYSGAYCDIPVDYCSNNPCQNGGTCHSGDSSVGFRCECSAQYSGHLCQMKSKSCSGVLDAEEGSLIYPLNNNTYEHNSKCAWVIHTVPNKVINVTFSKFHLELEPECRYDFLQIHDGQTSSSQLIGRFCGNEMPRNGNIISSHNNLYLWFRSDKTVAKDGFALHWNSISPICGAEIDATTYGQIKSPGSPGKYPPNRDCYWHLTTTLGKRILLHFFALDIETHSNCSFDYLDIYDGAHITDPLLNRYCNSTQPPPLQSASSEMLLHFHSDAFGAGYGFQITYAPVEGVPGCGGYFTLDKGDLVSPSYNGLYLNNLLCEYKITTDPDSRISLTFISFSLEYALRCRYDYLKVYDGPSANSKLVGKFCGNSYPKTYVSSTNNLFIIFKTDHSSSSEGFKISFKTVCRKTMFGDSGIIKSPGYPFKYPESKVCEYVIGTAPGKAIQLAFQDFDIEDNIYHTCEYDNLEIRDGPDQNATLLGKFCGGSSRIPPVQTSTLNYLYLRFNSDMSNSGTGFYANYTTIDTECGGIYREQTGLITYPPKDSTYKHGQKCKWLLIAPEGYHIKLNWNRFDLENMRSCSSDYVELTEIDGNNLNETLGRFCGHSPPPSLTSTTNQLLLTFISDDSVTGSGFSLSYTYLDDRTHCGAVYVKSHGFIYSPGWPKRYEPNHDCIWTITVPIGQQIMLNISQFDLERPIRGKCDLGDYLELRNGASQNSPLIGKYCGSFKTKHIISVSNKLYVKFHSDFYISGKGFKIEWDGTITGCGGTLTSSTGSISSPNYPDSYYENAECFYRIVTSPGSRIRIQFNDLDLERSLSCKDDFVEIFDGRDENTNSLGRFCYMKPNLSAIESSSNIVYIKFRTDAYIVSRGFLFNYDTICKNNITGRYGVIESPDCPGNYRLNLNCLWTITVPKGNKINVTFTHFDIHKSYRNSFRYRLGLISNNRTMCPYDWFQWKETRKQQFSKKYCGSIPPEIGSTESNSLQIKFVTGPFIPRTGFRLEWVSYGCGGYIRKMFGTISIDKTIVTDGELECEWIIESPFGTTIITTFTSVLISDAPNCTIDAIEVYNGPTVNTPLITKFCQRSQTLVQSTTNFMLIRFIKRSSLRDIYFVSNFHSRKSKCGATIMAPTGIISSQSYPRNYDNNIDCVWSLKVPVHHRIEVNFIDLDLYSNDQDEEDSCGDNIKIYNSRYIFLSNYSEVICPDSQIKQVISKSNFLQLQFVTNSHGTAKGFKANFTVTCGAVINATHDGVITSEGLVSNIKKNCVWIISAPSPDQKISFTISYMSLPKNYDILSNKSCPSSYLRIRDGDDERAPIAGEYCGRKTPPTLISHGSSLTVEFGTYTDVLKGRFSALFSTLTNSCGGSLSSEEGAIASPNYPQPYPINTDCEWSLRTAPGNKVFIIFESFDLQFSEGCNQDYLEIRENDNEGKLLGVYCGNEIPTKTITASKLHIKFHSDSTYSAKGFMINYGFIHGNEIWGSDSGKVASPLYPFPYEGPADYSWRITVSSGSITLIVTTLEIVTRDGEQCRNSLAVYDGYDDDASLLNNLCGIILSDTFTIRTTSNVVYLKLKLDESNTGSLFEIMWSKTDTTESAEAAGIQYKNCGNSTYVVKPQETVNFHSPNFPNNYDDNLNCTWVYKPTPGYHLELRFLEFKLEERSECYADYISIYYSNKINKWDPIKLNVCLFDDVKQTINATTSLKISFSTDRSISAKGFSAQVRSVCGGTLRDVSGFISPTWFDWQQNGKYLINCNWIVKVRTGRMIKLQFVQFNITNTLECSTFVNVHNGESVESPMLGNGKYCGYSHENKTQLVTSSNSLFISYTTPYTIREFKTFKLWYEEITTECGTTAILSSDHNWEEITSPNYPSIPTPYIECVWKFTGPPGEIIRIDINRIDLEKDFNCKDEYIEVRDGSSELAQLIERICGSQTPATIKTTNNALYLKYSTQKAIPNNGFIANVSIDTCGGTIIADSGEITSPGYPHMPVMKVGSVCVWHLIGNKHFTFSIAAQDINLPESETPCETKITIEESFPENNSVTILKTFCSNDYFDPASTTTFTATETLTSNILIKLHIGKPSEYTQFSVLRGFRFTYDSSVPQCGGRVNTPDGYLTTPAYPRDTTLLSCYWRITVPDETRRVTLQFLDADIQRHRINIYNDLSYRTLIQKIPSEDYSPITDTFESSGNTMIVHIWLDPRLGSHHRFKARFNSDKPALCGTRLSAASGQFTSPLLNRAYKCTWLFSYDISEDHIQQPELNSTDQLSNYQLAKTLYLKVNLNSSKVNPIDDSVCRFTDPTFNIKSATINNAISYSKHLCGKTEFTLRIPSTVIEFSALKGKSGFLNFQVYWKVQPCGGVFHATENFENLMHNISGTYNKSLDCAWIVRNPYDTRVVVMIEGNFEFECIDEFISISSSLYSSQPLGEYCKDRPLDGPILLKYSMLYIQYHTKTKINNNIKVLVKSVMNQCGGNLLTHESSFESPNYPKNYKDNEECTWEIKTDIGSRISLTFYGRFAVEDRPNCTKDAVIIYDWKDNSYKQIARLCGRVKPSDLKSSFNKMKVVLRTDNNITLEGFQAKWKRICGGDYVATTNKQYLYSPGYPFPYDSYLNCVYKISGGGQAVMVQFLDFQLEGPYPDCANDNLTIQGDSKNEFLYGVIYCGRESPPYLSYETLTLTLRSDMFTNHKGFKLLYMIDSCGGEIIEPIVLTSNTMESYRNNLNCTWKIKAPINKTIVLRFIYFDLESSTECQNDYLAIYDGLLINEDKRLSLMCGRDNNSTYVLKSTENTMLLEFITDSSFQLNGFKIAISFAYSTAVGCGGFINLTSHSTYTFRSPLINSSSVYENFLDCHWTIIAPEDQIIRIQFTAFHVAPCQDLNQTALGYSNCDCDYVEIRDGIAPNSNTIDKYCGHTLPPVLFSSSNGMSVILFTDGEINSSGFEATVSFQPSLCGQSTYKSTQKTQTIMSPNYESGSLSSGVYCVYHIELDQDNLLGIHLHIKSLNIDPGSSNSNQCNRDWLSISKINNSQNKTLGKDHIMSMSTELYFNTAYLFEQSYNSPKTFVFCGYNKSIDLYFIDSVTVTFHLSAESDIHVHRGFVIEMMDGSYCGRNYTEPYGRVRSIDGNYNNDIKTDCYTLITAPENYTISAYFLAINTNYWDETYLEIHDGNNTGARSLKKIIPYYSDNLAVFSSGNYMLIHNHVHNNGYIGYDFTYVTSDKGPGCGGTLHNEVGRITSPMYPNIYRKKITCEWELETPSKTRLFLKFSEFNLGRECDQVYLMLVNRKGETISTFCSEAPADYTSDDNYVKVVFVITMNNGGTGWVAEFVGKV